jgi:hypothetical protein
LLLVASAHAGPIEAVPEKNICADAASPLALGSAQWNGWGRDVENTRYQPEPAIRASDVPKLALKWAFGFQGSAVAGQPTVVDGRLFVVSSAGRIYSLDAKTGCTYWTFDAPAGTRTVVSIGEFAPPRSAAAPKYAAGPRRKHGGSKKSKRQFTLAHLDILKAPSGVLRRRYRRGLCAGRAERHVAVEDRGRPAPAGAHRWRTHAVSRSVVRRGRIE